MMKTPVFWNLYLGKSRVYFVYNLKGHCSSVHNWQLHVLAGPMVGSSPVWPVWRDLACQAPSPSPQFLPGWLAVNWVCQNHPEPEMSVSAVKENGYSEMITSYKQHKGQEQSPSPSSQNVSILKLIFLRGQLSLLKAKHSHNTAFKKIKCFQTCHLIHVT